MATFIEIQDNKNAKHLVNITQVRNIEAWNQQCKVHFVDEKYITTEHTYQEVKEAINSASSAPGTIYSIVEAKAPDSVGGSGSIATLIPARKGKF